MAKFIKHYGLKPLPRDTRDFKLSAILKLPKLEELPDNFELEPISIKNQLESDYCTQEASCGVSELQEGVELSPEWCFAVSKMISGDPDEFGQDLRTACKVHTKYGAIEKKDAPYSLENGDEDLKMRYITNWPEELFEKALKHKKQSYFKVDGQYDFFDDIKSFIYANRDKKQAVILGVEWDWPLEMKIIEPSFAPGGGHAVFCRGFKKLNGKDYLIVRNSYGKEAGDNGDHYFPRDVINNFVEKYGAFAFIDLPVEEAKAKSWSIFRRILEAIKKYLNGGGK